MHSKLQKWGNSMGLRIPKLIAREAELKYGDTVDIGIEDGTVVVRPVTGVRVDLKALLRKVTRKNLHREVLTGRPVGRESW